MELSAVPLFAGLSAVEARRVRGLAVERIVPTGEVVVEAGRHANAFYLVMDGRADVKVRDEVVAARGPGEWFGEAAFLDDERRHGTVVAGTELTLLVWPGDRLREVLARNPEVLQHVLGVVRSRHV